MIVLVSWILLVGSAALFAWFFILRARGSLRYWIRRVESNEEYVLGKTFQADDRDGHSQFFTDGNAAVRSLDRRTNRVWRQWDRKKGSLFLGLVMSAPPDEEPPEGYELRKLSKSEVVRLSGTNRIDEDRELDAVRRYAKENNLKLDYDNPARLSGQSFGLYQWDILEGCPKVKSSMIADAMEMTYQLRNNLVIPLLATLLAIALMGTAQPLMLVLGIVLICLLSGACKFVFIHQMTDEADEIHLQNY